MKKLKLIVLAVIIALLLSACGESTSDRMRRNLNSGLDKLKSGDTSSMTDEERRIVNDFLSSTF